MNTTTPAGPTRGLTGGQRVTRSLAAAALVGLVLPISTAAPAGAEDEAYSGFSTESSAAPIRIEIYEPTIPIPASPQGEVELGYSHVEADTGSSRGRASYLWPGDAVGEGFKTIVENLGLPAEISGPVAAQGYPFQVNSTSPTGEAKESNEPFPGMVMRTSAAPDKTVASSGYSTDCQVESAEDKGDGGGDDEGGDVPGLPGLPLPGSDDSSDETTSDKSAKSATSTKSNKSNAEEPEESCKIPAELAGLIDFGGYAASSTSANDGDTVVATSRAALTDIDLLGGVITISGVHTTSVAASDGATGDPAGKARYGTLAIAGQEFTLGPDGAEGSGQKQEIPGLPDDPAKALEQLGIQIAAPKPDLTKHGDEAISTVAGLVVTIDTTQLRSMLDAIPFGEIVGAIPNETGQLKSVIGAAVNLSPKFVITLGDARSAVDTVQGIEIPTTPTTGGGGGGGGEGNQASASGGGSTGGGGGSVPVAGAPAGGAPSSSAADGDLTGAEPMGSGLPPLNSIPGALTFGGIALAAAAGTWLRKIGAIALGGAGSCMHGLDRGLPDLRKA